MSRKIAAAACLLILLALMLTACLRPQRSPDRTLSPDDLVNTAAAKTVSALGTEIASGSYPTLVDPLKITRTATQTPTTHPTQTAQTTASPNASLTPAGGSPTAGPSPTGGPCTNAASFVSDVTIPDGSVMLPGFTFTKTWALKNTGTCTWNSGYQVVFANQGNAMQGASTPLLANGEVKPGDTAQVSVTLHAPGETGDYAGYWLLNGPDNQPFGTGPKASAPFFVKITVGETFAFADYTCAAKWSSTQGALPCPGQTNSAGFIVPVQNPRMEDGQSREGNGWDMMPQSGGTGEIVGRFPAFTVPERSDFHATLSCHPDMPGCYVRFRVTYQVDNGTEQVLGEWNEGNDGNVTTAVKDLDMLAGKSVVFNFYLTVAGPPDQSRGIWFNPVIVKN